MTKKKAIIYLIIFIVLVTSVQVLKRTFLYDDTKNFPKDCKIVIAPSCQVYINKITAQKKYAEAVKIQQVRIKENQKILAFYKFKIKDKCLFDMTAAEVQKSEQACIGSKKVKEDYLFLKTAEFTIQDILVDSLAVSQIQYNELKDKKSAVKTIKDAKKVLKNNKYFPARDVAFSLLDYQLSKLK